MLELYDGGIDEFFINLSVTNPKVESNSYVSYEITIETNNISFTESNSSVRRRFSEFILLRKLLLREFPAWKLPSLPPKFPFKNHFNPAFIEKRRKGLEEFLKKLVSERIYLSSKALHLFLQSNHPVSEIKEIIQIKEIPKQLPHDHRYISQRFPELYTTNQMTEEFSTLSLSSHTEADRSGNSTPIHSSAHGNVTTQNDSNSPAESKRVSFCDQVTVAQIYI